MGVREIAVVTLSPEASVELLRRVTTCDEANPIVVVGWLPSQIDLLRSSEGNAVWAEIEPNQWAVHVMSIEDLPVSDEQVQNIGDLRVFFVPQKSGVSQVTVTFKDGQFHVR